VFNANRCHHTAREEPAAHCIGGWVCPKARMNGYGKSRPQQKFDPRNFHAMASRYNNYAVLAQCMPGQPKKETFGPVGHG
jgi:hypothetical protein